MKMLFVLLGALPCVASASQELAAYERFSFDRSSNLPNEQKFQSMAYYLDTLDRLGDSPAYVGECYKSALSVSKDGFDPCVPASLLEARSNSGGGTGGVD